MNPWAFVFHPSLLVRRLFRRLNCFSTQTKLDLDLFPRPYYAYGLHQACLQAKHLGIGTISVLEFGVAGGTGLVTIETIAEELERFTGVQIEVYGFDTGQGLPAAPDPRDLPYVWQRGFYKMDETALRAKLKRAKLILGPVADTVGRFVATHRPAPVGFISFDMDYYTSTRDAFRLFDDNPPETFLPRVFCYFDDIIGRDEELHCEHVGELLAIAEFNAGHERKKIGKIYGLAHKRIIHAGWCEQMFVLHDFGHPRYCEYASGEKDKQLRLG